MELDDKNFFNIIDNLHDGLYIVDKDRIIKYWNKAAESISGFNSDEVVGSSCSDHILTHIDDKGNNLCCDACPLTSVMENRKPCFVNAYMHHKDGYRIPVSIRVNVLTNIDGKVIGGVELFKDISNQEIIKERIRELNKLVFLDHLTKIANRQYIEREIVKRIEEMKRIDVSNGVLFLDIDHFRNFNNTYGHDVGDKVLKFIANTLISNSRPYDLFGRWGGEEFIGLVRAINKKDLENIGNRIRIQIGNSYILHKQKRISVTVSIGGSLIHKDDNIRSIIKKTDILMYKSKKVGRNCLTIG